MNSIERHVLLLIGENPDSPDVFTDNPTGMEQIRTSIEDGLQEIVMLTGGYEEELHIPLSADKTFYRLYFARGYFGWVMDAWLIGEDIRLEQTGIASLTIEDPRWMTFTGSPRAYFQIGLNVIGIYPKSGSTSDIVRLRCVVIPQYDHEAQIQIRRSFQDAVVNYAVAEYWASRGDANEAATHYQLYTDILGAKFSYTQSRQHRQMMTQKNELVRRAENPA